MTFSLEHIPKVQADSMTKLEADHQYVEEQFSTRQELEDKVEMLMKAMSLSREY